MALHTELKDAYTSFSEAGCDELVKMSSGTLEPDFATRVQELSRQGWRIRDAVEATEDTMDELIEDLHHCVKARKLRRMLRLPLKDRMAKYEQRKTRILEFRFVAEKKYMESIVNRFIRLRVATEPKLLREKIIACSESSATACMTFEALTSGYKRK